MKLVKKFNKFSINEGINTEMMDNEQKAALQELKETDLSMLDDRDIQYYADRIGVSFEELVEYLADLSMLGENKKNKYSDMKIKKFNENWEQEEGFSEIEAVSNVLNDTGAYNKIGEVLDLEINGDSDIFREIEEFIVMKYKEMASESE